MSSRLRQRLFLCVAIISFLFASIIAAYAESINYVYDDLNRLIKVVYGNGTIINYTYDEVGNRLEQKIQEPDTTPPTTTASPPGGNYTSIQPVTLTCDDGVDSFGCDKIYFTTDGSTPTTSSTVYTAPISLSTPTTLKFFAKDLAGNTESVKTQTYIVDTSPPTGTIIINSGATSTNSTSVNLTLTCNDNMGCAQMQFSNDNVTYSTAEAYAATKSWTLSTGDGTKTVYVRFKDTTGNWSPAYRDTIIMDTTAPTTTASPAGGLFASALLVTLGCNDGSGSGCDKIYYTTDGSTPTTSSAVYSSLISISSATTLKYFAIDHVGNSESVKTQIYTFGSLTAVRISGSYPRYFSTLQEAYNAALNGDIIQAQATTFTGNLNLNRNISVTLTGGYNSNFSSNAGNVSQLIGIIQTTAGGGSLTIGNFSIQINTTPTSYQVTPSIGTGAGHGTITPNTVQTVNQGNTTSFTVTPDTGYTASVGGTCGGTLSGTTYTTNPITADCTVIADFTITTPCENQPVRIAGTTPTCYSTLQQAYNAALNGDIIQVKAITLTGNLNINRNISVTLEGGYNSDFSSNTGNITHLKGVLQIMSGGSALTIKNIQLDIQ